MSDRIDEKDLPQVSPAPTARLRAVQNGKSVLVPLPDVVNASALIGEAIESISDDGRAQMDQAIISVENNANSAIEVVSREVEQVINQASAEASAILSGLGYLPPVEYESGLEVDSSRFTVTYDGVTYAPVADEVPFTTTGTFDPDQWRVIQGVNSADLATASGALMIGVKQPLTDSVLRTLADKALETISIMDFGAALDGVTDDSIPLLKLLTACAVTGRRGLINSGVLAISPTTFNSVGDLDIQCDATVINLSGSSADGPLLRLNGSQLYTLTWSGGAFDLVGGAFSGLFVSNWRKAVVRVKEVSNISCTTSSNSNTSGILIQNVRTAIVGCDLMFNLQENTATQGSIPRCVTFETTDGLRADGTLLPGYHFEDVHGGVLVGNMHGGVVMIGEGIINQATDNGIYNAGNASRVIANNMHQYATEEPIVNIGAGVVEYNGGSIIDFTNSIALQNCGGIELNGTTIRTSSSGTTGAAGNIFKTRPTNTSSDHLHVRNCTIYARTNYAPLDFNSGDLLEFIDQGNRWIYVHDSDLDQGNILLRWSGNVRKFESDGSVHVLTSVSGDIPNGDYFLQFPETTELSRWNSEVVNETGNSSSRVRLSGLRRQLVTFNGLYSVENISSDCEPNRGALTVAPPREVWGTAAPTNGYWPAGSRMWNKNVSAGGTLGWVCVSSGSPGTWKVFGSVAS